MQSNQLFPYSEKEQLLDQQKLEHAEPGGEY